MKPKNFPAKKLRRQLVADGRDLNSEACIAELTAARNIKNKKDRGK